MMCTVHLFSEYTSIYQKIVTVITYLLIINALQMPRIKFRVNVATGVAFDVASDVRPF